MSSRILATLDPHRLGPLLTLDQGNLVVTTTDTCDIHRSVFGSLAMGAGSHAFECYFYSTSRPTGGLVNLLSVGVAAVGSSLTKYVGQEATSWGLRAADGKINNNDADITSGAIQPIAERQCIGVYLINDPTTPICAWHVNGNLLFQATLTAGVFYVPAISIGSASPADVSAFVNFGQRALDYPYFTADQ